MMATSDVVAGSHQLNERLQAMAKAAGGEICKKALMRGGLVIERNAKENIRKHHLIDTGNLRASVTAEPESNTVVTIGPRNVLYALIHEYGGTIEPVTAKYLAVPLTKEAKKIGSPRNMGDLTIIPGRRQKTFVMLDAAGVAQYVLVKSVRIPARPYMRPALDEHLKEIETAIADGFLALTRY